MKLIGKQLNESGIAHLILPLVVIVVVGGIGSILLMQSHADTNSGFITGEGGMCIDLNGSAKVGTELETNTCSESSATQDWTIPSDGTIRIGNFCLIDKSNSTVPMTHARIGACDGGADAKWTISTAGVIINPTSKLCLEDKDGNVKVGNTVWLNTCVAGSASQTWAVPKGTATTPITAPAPSPTLSPTPAPSGGTTVSVSTAAQLISALSAAKPGQTIKLADGTYSGNFNSIASGTAAAPITITGSRNAIINGGALTGGYTLSLGTKDSASTVSYWNLEGFTVTGGQKGIMFDNVQHSIVNGVYVHQIGEEGVHLRDNSANDMIENSTITKTGQAQQAYGEGIYVGSAVSNWKTYSMGSADHANNNQILNNSISYTGAENIDVKEGTHSGTISGNTFNGSGMCWDTSADCNYADSMIDMKGAGWTVSNNSFANEHVVWVKGGQTNDGIQDHVISGTGNESSGDDNTFTDNTVNNVGGYGFDIQSSATGVVVSCNNKVTGANSGFANVACKQ